MHTRECTIIRLWNYIVTVYCSYFSNTAFQDTGLEMNRLIKDAYVGSGHYIWGYVDWNGYEERGQACDGIVIEVKVGRRDCLSVCVQCLCDYCNKSSVCERKLCYSWEQPHWIHNWMQRFALGLIAEQFFPLSSSFFCSSFLSFMLSLFFYTHTHIAVFFSLL